MLTACQIRAIAQAEQARQDALQVLLDFDRFRPDAREAAREVMIAHDRALKARNALLADNLAALCEMAAWAAECRADGRIVNARHITPDAGAAAASSQHLNCCP